eukprot:scaffold323497_cov59-Attheya_sp.AAC.2
MSCATRSDVAKLLCVAYLMGRLISSPIEAVCPPVEGCNNLGVRGNYGDRYAFHGKTWFPRARDDQKKLRPNRHGYELLGPEFQRNFKSGACSTCCCE